MTNTYSIEQLDAKRVQELWTDIRPILVEACDSNEISSSDLSPEVIKEELACGTMGSFGFFEGGKLLTILVMRFTDTHGHLGVELIAMAGQKLMVFKSLYWQYILDWFKANGAEFVDAFANPRVAHVYMNKFGFDKSCTFVRMTL